MFEVVYVIHFCLNCKSLDTYTLRTSVILKEKRNGSALTSLVIK